MKTTHTIVAAAMAATLATAAVAARATDPAAPGVHWGDRRPLGRGTAAAWVAVDVDGTPCSMGVSLDDAALAAARDGREAEVLLPLPEGGAPAGGAGGRTAFRVRYDRARRAWLVMLDGALPAAASPAALSARAAAR